MTSEERIHTCGRCQYENVPDQKYPCNQCIWNKDIRQDLWTPKRDAEMEQPKWILLNERPPEDGTWNIFTDGKTISVERYKYDAIAHFYPNGRWFSLEEAVAWMPLPDSYKGESEEEK